MNKKEEEEDDPFLNQTEKEEKKEKVIRPLSENEIAEYTQIFYSYLDKDGN